MRISDWSSDACSSDLLDLHHQITDAAAVERGHAASPETYLIAMLHARPDLDFARLPVDAGHLDRPAKRGGGERYRRAGQQCGAVPLEERMLFQVDEDVEIARRSARSEEHTSELQSLTRSSSALF